MRQHNAATYRAAVPVFAALGDEHRLALVRRLCAGGPASLSRLAEGARITRQGVTKHLRVLEDAGLVKSTRQGRESIWELEPEVLARVSASHATGTFNGIRCAAPYMRLRRWGRIVNLVSRAGLVGIPGTAAYAAGKGAVFALTNVAARDLAPFGITVNAVNPASTETRMVTQAVERGFVEPVNGQDHDALAGRHDGERERRRLGAARRRQDEDGQRCRERKAGERQDGTP